MEGAAITETEVTVRKVRGGSIGSEKEMLDGASSSGSGSSGKGEDKGAFEYFGWIYHLGTNSIGHDYCHLRFLFIRGKYVEMFKRDPHENPGISDKGTLVKAVGVVDASADTVFEVFLNLDQQQRYEWKSNRDFVFSRQWFRGQDGTYTSSWEIRNLSPSTGSNTARCLVSQMLEMNQVGWCRWKQNRRSDFEKTTPYAMLTQVAGLKEYIGASPALRVESSTTVVRSKSSMGSIDFDAAEVNDEFYDATDGESSSDEEEGDSDGSRAKKDGRVKLKNVSWAIAGLSLKKTSGTRCYANDTLDPNVPPISIEANEFNGSLHKGKDEKDSNCWTSPNGSGFKIRGRTYLKDNSKVVGGDPLLELIAVDWFKVDRAVDGVAQHPECLLQTAAGKKLPFVLVINLQVQISPSDDKLNLILVFQIPAKPNYSLVLYYAADRPVNKESLLGKFIDGTDMFRDSRFKLIPSIVEGYWMVKRAVGTKACLLGKAVTCKYLRQDNFLEIDVDIGSSSVARSVIGLVLGYVTSLVVDLAILVEGKEESELPEFILGTVRLNKLKLETAVTLEV
ncbi:Protein ENHANCED DISEASE RESISTANCE 2 [Linum grandiflorum]